MLQELGKVSKGRRSCPDIKTELKSAYSASGRRVKRLQRTEDDFTPQPTVKKQLSIVSSTTTCSSNLPLSTIALPRLAVSPIFKPKSCLFDNGAFSFVRRAFPQVITSSPNTKENQPKSETKTKVIVEYPSKTINKTLSGDMEPIVKALAHGPTTRIAKTIIKYKSLRKEVITQVLRVVLSEMNQLCSRKNP